MQELHEFNADAFICTVRYVSRAFCLLHGTQWRAAATRQTVGESRVLMAEVDALLVIDARRLGWLWPAPCSVSPAEEDRRQQPAANAGPFRPTRKRSAASTPAEMTALRRYSTGS
jgi:hypothetical protein